MTPRRAAARPLRLAEPGGRLSLGARTGPIRALLLLLGLVSLTGMPYMVLMPIFADRILHSGARGLGLLMGAAGVGALRDLALAARHGVRGLGRWVMFAAMGFGVSLILFSFSHWFWLSVLLVMPAGFAMILQMASIQHADSNHGTGRIARPRHGRLLHDVHGHGAIWGVARRAPLRSMWSARSRCGWGASSAWPEARCSP